jgi:hypothetical protein
MKDLPLNRTDDPIGECFVCDEAIGGRGRPWMRHEVGTTQGMRWKDVCLECIRAEEDGPQSP